MNIINECNLKGTHCVPYNLTKLRMDSCFRRNDGLVIQWTADFSSSRHSCESRNPVL